MLPVIPTWLPGIPTWVHFVEMAALVAVAEWRGGDEERVVAGYNLVSNGLGLALGVAVGFDSRFEVAWGLLDTMVYLAIGLRSARWWTLAAASVALVNFSTALAILASPVTLWTFAAARLIWYYALNLVIFTGAWTTHGRRLASAG
jgi:hypothetical protein